jgi:membrane protease YdiL (CAAX protease family)
MTITDRQGNNHRLAVADTAAESPELEVPSYPGSKVMIPQYSRRSILAIWAAAAVPMGVLSWIAAPALAHSLHGSSPLVRALLLCFTAGLVWQFVLVIGLVWYEQRNLRWTTLRDALWLRRPQNPKSGRRGGKTWWIVAPLIVALAAEEMIPVISHAANRDFGIFMGSKAGHTFMHGAWFWFALIIVEMTFNTVLGEELLFRGFLLPRMNGAFGERDWIANGVLFATYHLHMPWVIPAALCDTFILTGPTKRYRSAWIGIAVHSAQSVLFVFVMLALVL